MTARLRMTLPTLCAAASVALAAGLGGAAFAHPHAEGDGNRVNKVIILDGKNGHRGPEGARELRMLRPTGEALKCDGEETRVDEKTDKEHTRIVICGDDKLSASDRAARLEKTLAEMRANQHLGADHKVKVEAALERAIARLRASN